METLRKPHAAILSSPGLGHLIPVLELAKRLVVHHNFVVTVFAISSHTSPAEARLLESSTTPKLYDVVELPSPDISGQVGPDAAVVTCLAAMMRTCRPSLMSAMKKNSPDLLIVDLFGTESLSIADELGIPKYVFVASHAWFLALTIYLPALDEEVKGQFVDQKERLRIPGCSSLRPQDVVDPMLDRNDQQYREYRRIGTEIPRSDGVLLNTWEDLHKTTLEALRNDNLLGRFCKVPVYAVGPMTRSTAALSNRRDEIFDWLDKQPEESVVFASFGSGGTLSYEQTTELAWGLELSQQRFTWVMRPPTSANADAAFFVSGKGSGDPISSYLPDGFLDRTRDLGRIISMWSEQAQILSHPSVGCFISHCGWNSTLESLTNGVPMIAWPLYSEQKMNAAMLTEELGVAVAPDALPTKKVVGREEIEKMVRKIMVEKDGCAIRARAKEVKNSAKKALSEEGCSSNVALSRFAKQAISFKF